MKLFLDSANLEEIREAVRWGGIDGVTTNPSLMAKEQRDFAGHIRAICEAVKGPVSAETVSADVEGMLREGRHLATIHPNVVVKVPLTKEGLQSTRLLRQQKIRVNVTLCFSSAQALLAAKAGATYISPFVGRLDDIGEEGMALIRDIRTIYNNYRFSTEILTASCRSPMHVVEAAKAGSDIATVPFAVLEQLVKHPLTTIGLERFLSDWAKIPSALRASILPTGSSTPAATARPVKPLDSVPRLRSGPVLSEPFDSAAPRSGRVLSLSKDERSESKDARGRRSRTAMSRRT